MKNLCKAKNEYFSSKSYVDEVPVFYLIFLIARVPISTITCRCTLENGVSDVLRSSRHFVSKSQ